MANKRITDVDYINSLSSDESFFINHNNSIKQINKSNVVFDIVNGGTGADNASDARTNLGLGSVSTENTVPISKGGTGATTAATALTNLGVTATASELNVMDGITATTTELNYCDGVTSNIQTQLNAKAESSHGTHVTYGTSASALGTSSAGTATTVSRSDHVHALPALTSCTGTLTLAKGGTGATNGATGLKNLFAAGYTMLSANQYGDDFPTGYVHSSSTKGTIFFKKVSS